MKFSEFFQKLKREASFKPQELPSSDDFSSFDVFFQTTYMSAIAQAEIRREKLFTLAAQLPCPIAEFFAKVDIICNELAYDYAEGCRTVGEIVQDKGMRSLLLRFSNSLAAGESLSDFMGNEAQVQAAAYENEYERDLESMSKWTDAYGALMVSVSLVIIINAVSTLIYEISAGAMTGMAVVATFIGAMGSWIIWRSSPKEVGQLSLPGGSKEQVLASTLMRTLLPGALILCFVLFLVGVDLGWVLLLMAILLLPLAILGQRDDKDVFAKNQEFAFFIRTLGGMATSAGTTLTEGLTRVNLRSFPALAADIEKLSLRLIAGIDPRVCWERFRAETGSELINQSASMFYDSVILGGEPENVGFFASLYASQVTGLQGKRRAVAGTFVGLSYVMHAVVVGLLILIIEIVSSFLKVLSAVGTPDAAVIPLPVFSFDGAAHVHLLYNMVQSVIIVLTLTTAFALKSAQGGQRGQFFLFLCILLFISALCLLGLPIVANSIFGGLAM